MGNRPIFYKFGTFQRNIKCKDICNTNSIKLNAVKTTEPVYKQVNEYRTYNIMTEIHRTRRFY